jgi:hypothetical protein
LASKTRNKAAVRSPKGKGGRRPAVRVKSGPDLMLLPIAVGGILLALAAGLLIYYFANRTTSTTPTKPVTAAGIPCDHLEQTTLHYHAAIQIVYQGIVHPIPPNIGIQGNPAAPTCYYWLHVHAANLDVIHIETPANRTFTLGDFFTVWTTWNRSQGKPAEPLNSTHVSTITLTPDEKLVVYIDLSDGKGAHIYEGDPKSIVLKPHEIITLEITPPAVTPPPPFTFASGL